MEMYRKLSYEELIELKSTFFETLSDILSSDRLPSFKDYLNFYKAKGPEVYHFARQACIWRTVFQAGSPDLTLFDEQEKIELAVDPALVAKLNNLLKDPKKIALQKKNSFSIEQQLVKKFEEGGFDTIQGKDYLVYDIETSYGTNDLRQTVFYIGYAYIVSKGSGSYRLITQDNIAKFLDYLVEFDGYIIGYNSLAFDNPVTVSQGIALGTRSHDEYQDLLHILNQKSLDIFQFVWGLTGKRIGLNKLSRSLVGLGKTLESGKEAQTLWEAYQEGDTKALSTLKTYCKNDVKMTYLCLWYLLAFQELGWEDELFTFDLEEFVIGSNKENTMEFYGQPSSSQDSSLGLFFD